eukprot:CAMPEP_0181171404 /NCGR_PEP_ID=MMETSP1096-20121128/1889_1 /TAXON_ID=156174 ORGANISM="Chrysochromulina ericina, Strain CCMP281" /NCGR_SAMPLE_ID=MMETSP1096 /ASSEMBLY_ACC=CAM_ASM_000453 /LENGTH=209 /DNA_ID=CAMNT_0023259045 /DNA_START=20 /DNA_END=649 /DNA_ORIENTATION=-
MERPDGGPASGSPEAVIVTIISNLLTDLVARNDRFPLVPTQVTPFHSSTPPAITVKNYLEDRILKYAGCSEETFILALIYMDQVVQFNPDFVICSLNVHRLLITSIMLASKFFDDVYYNNAYYARVGGISNAEVNSLEMEMLRMISFSLFVEPDVYERYRRSLYAHVQSDDCTLDDDVSFASSLGDANHSQVTTIQTSQRESEIQQMDV